MKVVAKQIDMAVFTDGKGHTRPIRFRYADEDESLKVVKVDKILYINEENFQGKKILVYTCRSNFGNITRLYELKFELVSCQWMLWKI